MSPTAIIPGHPVTGHAIIVFALMGTAVLLAAPSSYAQQILRIVPGRSQTGASFDGSWRDSGASTSRTYTQNNLREWLEIPIEGYVFSPTTLRYNLRVKPSLRQQYSTDLPDPFYNRSLDLNGNATAFSSRLLSMAVRGSRSSGVTSGGFGTQADFASTTFAPSVHFTSRPISGSAVYVRTTGRSKTQVGPQLTPVEQEHTTETTRLTIRNSKLNAGYEQSNFDDRLRATGHSVEGYHVHHWFRWGKGSKLTTRFEDFNRRGTLPYERRTWSEKAHIQHTTSTYTSLQYSQYRSSGFNGMSNGRSYAWMMNSQVSDGVSLGGRASRATSYFDGNSLSVNNVGLSGSVSRNLGRHSRISGRTSVGYLNRDRDGSLAVISVVDESYFVPNVFSFALNELHVVQSSVIVQNSAKSIVFQVGLDFDLTQIGNSTQIIVLAGSRIEEGATVLVSYQYESIFDQRNDGFVYQAAATLQLDGVTLRHNRSRRATSVVGDGARLSGDFRQNVTGLTVRRRISFGEWRLDVDRRARKSTTISYRTVEAKSSLAVPVVENLRLLIDSSAKRVSERDDRVDLISFAASLMWRPYRQLQVACRGRAQDWRQQSSTRIRLFTGQLSADYTVRQLQIRARYDYDRRNMGFETSGHRISTSVTRRL